MRRLGDEVEIGPIGFGCWRFTSSSDAHNTALISTALDLGMNLIDTSDVYGLDWGGSGFGSCEEALGRVLDGTPSLRERMVLATKGGIIPGVPYDSSGAYLIAACEASLRRLGVDYVDLYQVHRPDMFTHPEEIAVAFASLRDRGLVSMFGVSNYTPSQTMALSAYVEEPLVSTQPEFSCATLAPLRDGTLDLCMEEGITPLAWSPLAGGRLATGHGLRPDLLSVLDELAEREGVSRAAIAIAFVLAHPADAVALVGTQTPERLTELVASTRVQLSRTDVYRIVVASDGVPLP
ncbi:MAG: aldo/keto reductase [Actinobacteria bacterium]|nr:aldo/keto reductase [Actinomycetota bacterium]